MLLMTDIHIRSFSGASIRPYIHSLAKLRSEVLRDYPYFEEPDLNANTQYLKSVTLSKEAIAVLIFDNTTLVGASLGYPLELESPSLQQPFKDRHLEISSYYFFGESLLLKPYKGRGIGHHFFDAREAHVTHFPSFKHICFCVPIHTDSETNKQQDFVPLHDFWRKRGYIHHPEMQTLVLRRKIGDKHPGESKMSFWIKDLSEKT